MVWLDEFGKPVDSGRLDCFNAPVVVDANGMPADKLFGAILKGQLGAGNAT
jgi:hypothetical protein